MNLTLDKDFEEALASPEALEQHLVRLQKVRQTNMRRASIAGVVTTLLTFGVMGLGSAQDLTSYGLLVAALAIIALDSSLTYLIRANSAQADIRTLLAFRKLREVSHGREQGP